MCVGLSIVEGRTSLVTVFDTDVTGSEGGVEFREEEGTLTWR